MKKWTRRGILLVLLILLGLGTGTTVYAEEADSSEATEQIRERKGWHKDTNGKYYYVQKDGSRVKGWLTVKGKTYYLNAKGYRVTGWKKIKKQYYYFNSKGVRQMEWVTYKNKNYYCDPDNNGARTVG